MTTSRLPPLNALRAFEAAARHLSLTKAAEELGVTQAAVSHQVKGLEDALGVKLFNRLTRALALTPAGASLAPELEGAFVRIASAVERARERDTAGTVRLSLLTTIALTFLVPRLGRFAAKHPAIELRLETSARLVDFTREPIDAAIRYGDGHYPGVHADRLFDDVLTPLCAPSLAKKIRKPADVMDHPLLDDNIVYDEWKTWCAAAGVGPCPARRRAATFDSTRVAVEAAMEGMGIAIGAPFLFAAQIASGRLVQPLPIVTPSGRAYWFVCRRQDIERPTIRALRDWLMEETAEWRSAPTSSASLPGKNRPGRATAGRRSSGKAGSGPARGGGSGG
ncbi:MAG: transcriptional regulator GcvA [Alphaproteobacteria bacterium]|nr:transcriptional regulator GcvA [Alphaproteobacteria bacterium]